MTVVDQGGAAAGVKPSLRYRIANSPHPLAKQAKRTVRAVRELSIPAPRIVFWPILQVVLAVRQVVWFLQRVFYAEPLFKAYCTSYGRNFHTGKFLHFVMGRGRIVVGDDVLVIGKCSFIFAARYTPHPTLKIGSRTGIGHNCTFTVGGAITIGEDCRIAGNVSMLDVSGHGSDPEARKRGDPASADSVKPIVIGANVWIGSSATILPGVTIGDHSVIAAGAVVTGPVPPSSLMIGNPARRMAAV